MVDFAILAEPLWGIPRWVHILVWTLVINVALRAAVVLIERRWTR